MILNIITTCLLLLVHLCVTKTRWSHRGSNFFVQYSRIHLYFLTLPEQCMYCGRKHYPTVAERAQRAANRKNTCKLRKHFRQFDNTRCKCSQHNQKRNALQIKCIWLCCVHLQCVSLFVCVVSICTICCQTDENVFLICWCFFYLHVFSEVAAR